MIVITGQGTIETAVEAMKLGACDYVTKPVNLDRLCLLIEKTLENKQLKEENRRLKQQLRENGPELNIIGSSEALAKCRELALQVAPTNATVLIEGESGTGKELITNIIHYNSTVAHGPFIKVNCSAFSEGVLESELFGHEKGAFTGADRRREGRFIQAQGGTLFLDEIGETSPAMQAKLLRVLQEHELQRVGGQETLAVDARIIAATNRDLEEEVKKGNFREDLFYRLNVVVLDVPSLRERKGDIPLLAEYFLQEFARKNNRQVAGITPECMDILNRYPWPGNVRELENAIERGIILMRGEYLDVNGLPLAIQRWADHNAPEESERPATLKEAEKALILRTLEETDGNRSEAARRLQITRKTLLNKLKSYQKDGR
jgi:two-component system response regulator HydG